LSRSKSCNDWMKNVHGRIDTCNCNFDCNCPYASKNAYLLRLSMELHDQWEATWVTEGQDNAASTDYYENCKCSTKFKRIFLTAFDSSKATLTQVLLSFFCVKLVFRWLHPLIISTSRTIGQPLAFYYRRQHNAAI
jgi:hypothetical protein